MMSEFDLDRATTPTAAKVLALVLFNPPIYPFIAAVFYSSMVSKNEARDAFCAVSSFDSNEATAATLAKRRGLASHPFFNGLLPIPCSLCGVASLHVTLQPAAGSSSRARVS